MGPTIGSHIIPNQFAKIIDVMDNKSSSVMATCTPSSTFHFPFLNYILLQFSFFKNKQTKQTNKYSSLPKIKQTNLHS